MVCVIAVCIYLSSLESVEVWYGNAPRCSQRSVWLFGRGAEIRRGHCHRKRSTMCEPRDFCTVKLKNKLPESLMGTQKISEKNTDQNHCLPICATFTLCRDMFLFLYWSNTLKRAVWFLCLYGKCYYLFHFQRCRNSQD